MVFLEAEERVRVVEKNVGVENVVFHVYVSLSAVMVLMRLYHILTFG